MEANVENEGNELALVPSSPSSPSYNPICELEYHLLAKQEEVLRLRTEVDELKTKLEDREQQEVSTKNDQFIIVEQERKTLKGELADVQRKLQKIDENRTALIRDKEHIKLERDLERDLNRSLTNDLEVARRLHADLQVSLEREQERTQRQLIHVEQLNGTLQQGLVEAQHENIELQSIRARVVHLEEQNISLQHDLESITIEKHEDARISSERAITLESSVRTLQQTLSEEEKKNRELMLKLTEMNRENEELYDGMQQLEGLVQELQLRLREIEEDHSKTTSDLAAVKETKNELEAMNTQLQEQLTTLSQEFAEYKDDAENTIQSSSINFNGSEKHRAELQMLLKNDTTTIQALKMQVAEKADMLASVSQQFVTYKNDVESTIQESNAALVTTETALGRANNSYTELESENQQLRDQLMVLTKEFQLLKESTEDSAGVSKSTLNTTMRDLAAVKETKNELETMNTQLQEQLTTLSQEFTVYKDDAKNIIQSSNENLSESEKHLTELQLIHKNDTVTVQALEAANAQSQEQLMSLVEEFEMYKESLSRQTMKDGNEDKKLIRDLEIEAQQKQQEYCQQIAQLREEFEVLVQSYTSNHDDKIRVLEEKLREKQQELDVVTLAATNRVEEVQTMDVTMVAVGNGDDNIQVIMNENNQDSGTQTVNTVIEEEEKVTHVATTSTMTIPAESTTVSSQTTHVATTSTMTIPAESTTVSSQTTHVATTSTMTTSAELMTVSSQTVDIIPEKDNEEDKKQSADEMTVHGEGDEGEMMSTIIRGNEQQQQQQHQEELTSMRLVLEKQTQDYCQKLSLMRDELTSLRDNAASAMSAKQTTEKQMEQMQEQMQQIQQLFRQHEQDMIRAKVIHLFEYISSRQPFRHILLS